MPKRLLSALSIIRHARYSSSDYSSACSFSSGVGLPVSSISILASLALTRPCVYGSFSHLVIDNLDVGLECLHVFFICCIPPLKKCVETFFGLHRGPSSLHVSLHVTDDAPNELQEFNPVLCFMGLIVPFCYFILVLRDGLHLLVNREYIFLLPSYMLRLLMKTVFFSPSTRTPPYKTQHLIDCCPSWVWSEAPNSALFLLGVLVQVRRPRSILVGCS